MATGGDTNLTDDKIERLAEAIVVTKMETIAIRYMKIQSQMVTNLRVAHQGNPTGFNRAVLNVWKCMNPRESQIQVSPAPNKKTGRFAVRKYSSLKHDERILSDMSLTFFNVFESSKRNIFLRIFGVSWDLRH